MTFSRTTIYAVRALAHLAASGEDAGYVGAAELAEATGAPPNYLGKTMQLLVRRGLLEARRGKAGGVRLAFPPREISLLRIIEAIDGLEDMERCPLGNATCSNAAPCGIHNRWGAIRSLYVELLRATTLESVSAGWLK
jgi:Rrf2 family protein